MKLCAVEGCGKPARTRGYCGAHYRRVWRHGDPLAGRVAWGIPLKWLRDRVRHVDKTECLIWPFSRMRNGYPTVRANRRVHVASRLMCELANGPPPETWYEAAHSCGNGQSGCVNPHHVRWATPAENRQDKAIHGTEQRGSQKKNAKLTEENVREIRAIRGTATYSSIAKRFGVAPNLISKIYSGREWSWVE